MTRSPFVLLLILSLGCGAALRAQSFGYVSSAGASASQLSGNTVLIVRHAEQNDGTQLAPAGQARAYAYAKYFSPLAVDGNSMWPTELFAASDESTGEQPRLTMEPLARTSGTYLNSSVSSRTPDEMVHVLEVEPHGHTPLICWRGDQIPRLLSALGAQPATLLPDGRWPADSYDLMIVLRFDRAGKLLSQQAVHEPAFTAER